MALDPYAELRVARSATAKEIKQAYRRRIREVHPDRNPEDAFAAAKAQQVQEAFEILSDPGRRDAYDRDGETAKPPDLTAMAREMLCIEFIGLVGRGSTQRMVVELRGVMRRIFDEAKRETLIGAAANVRLRAVKNRFVCRADENFLAGALDSVIEKNSKGIADLDRRMRIATRAIELLVDFDDVDLAGLGRPTQGAIVWQQL